MRGHPVRGPGGLAALRSSTSAVRPSRRLSAIRLSTVPVIDCQVQQEPTSDLGERLHAVLTRSGSGRSNHPRKLLKSVQRRRYGVSDRHLEGRGRPAPRTGCRLRRSTWVRTRGGESRASAATPGPTNCWPARPGLPTATQGAVELRSFGRDTTRPRTRGPHPREPRTTATGTDEADQQARQHRSSRCSRSTRRDRARRRRCAPTPSATPSRRHHRELARALAAHAQASARRPCSRGAFSQRGRGQPPRRITVPLSSRTAPPRPVGVTTPFAQRPGPPSTIDQNLNGACRLPRSPGVRMLVAILAKLQVDRHVPRLVGGLDLSHPTYATPAIGRVIPHAPTTILVTPRAEPFTFHPTPLLFHNGLRTRRWARRERVFETISSESWDVERDPVDRAHVASDDP